MASRLTTLRVRALAGATLIGVAIWLAWRGRYELAMGALLLAELATVRYILQDIEETLRGEL